MHFLIDLPLLWLGPLMRAARQGSVHDHPVNCFLSPEILRSRRRRCPV